MVTIELSDDFESLSQSPPPSKKRGNLSSNSNSAMTTSAAPVLSEDAQPIPIIPIDPSRRYHPTDKKNQRANLHKDSEGKGFGFFGSVTSSKATGSGKDTSSPAERFSQALQRPLAFKRGLERPSVISRGYLSLPRKTIQAGVAADRDQSMPHSSFSRIFSDTVSNKKVQKELMDLKKKLEFSEKEKEKLGSSLKLSILSERTLQDQIDSQKAINAGLNVSIDALADILVRKEETIKELRKGMKEKKGGGKPAKKKFKFTIEVEVDDEKLEGTTVSVEK